MKRFTVGILAMVMVLAIASAASAHDWTPITRIERLITEPIPGAGYVYDSHVHLDDLPMMPIILLDGQMAMGVVAQYRVSFVLADTAARPTEVHASFINDDIGALGIAFAFGRIVKVTVSYVMINGTPRAVQVVGLGNAQWAREIPSN